jgi:hypothetical protein
MLEYEMEEEPDPNTKHIHVSIPAAQAVGTFDEKQEDQESATSSRHLQPKKERRKKIVSLTDAWSRVANAYTTRETQTVLLRGIQSSDTIYDSDKNILLTHLKTKQSGYKAQDTEKGIYDPTRFVHIDDIVATLCTSNLECYYCKGWTKLFYEFVRDPKQWSLERLSNAEGHNRDNVVIACLECNMRRRTMYHERYLATKQLRVNKLEPTEYDEAS